MTKEEYIEEKNDLMEKRLALFKKMHKIDNKIKSLNEEYILEKVPLRKGDKFIATMRDGNSVRLKVTKISIDEHRTANVHVDFMSPKWRKKRGFYETNEATISLYESKGYQLPSEILTWEKVNN